jgi:UrcA family protein
VTRKTLALIAAGAAGWMLASLAVAVPVSNPVAVRVSWSDLDLNRDAGVAKLYARLRHAAKSACGEADMRNLAASARADACVVHALADAVASVHNAKLSALHQRSAVASDA